MDWLKRTAVPYVRRNLSEFVAYFGWPTAIMAAYVIFASLMWTYLIASGAAYLFVARGSGYPSAQERILAEAMVITTGGLVLVGLNLLRRSPALV